MSNDRQSVNPRTTAVTPASERSEDPDLAPREICKSNPTEQNGTSPSDAVERQIDQSNPTEQSGTSQFDLAQREDGGSKPTEQNGTSVALTPRQSVALRLLARGHGTTRAAQRFGVTRQTIARWKRDPGFAAELDRIVRQLDEAALRLRAESRMHRYALYRAGAGEI